MTTSGFVASSDNNNIIGGNDNEIINGDSSSIISSSNSLLTFALGDFSNVSINSCIIGGSSNIIRGADNSCLIGSSGEVTASNSFLFSDGNSRVQSTANSAQFGVSGGMTVLTDNAGTTGVTIASGASSWAVVCDKNVKENIKLLNNMLSKIENINVYEFNYKGTSKNTICYSPMAQEWNAEFKSNKDNLKIEVMDMLGVSLQCIKELSNKYKILEEKIDKIVEKKIDKILEDKIDKILEDKIDKIVEKKIDKILEKKIDKIVEKKNR